MSPRRPAFLHAPMRWTYRTSKGIFAIEQRDGRWHVIFDGESLGSYVRPEQASEDLAGGATFWPAGFNPGELGIPEELSEWQRHA